MASKGKGPSDYKNFINKKKEKGTKTKVPFFIKNLEDKKNNNNKRPRKMIGVIFPSAKYGLLFAIIIIAIVLILELLKLF